MQTWPYTHAYTHTTTRSHAGKRNVTLSLLCQPLFISSSPPLSFFSSSLLSSNCASLHPWPCYLLEHLKVTGGGRGGGWKKSVVFSSSLASLFLTFSSFPSPCPPSLLFFLFILAFAITKHFALHLFDIKVCKATHMRTVHAHTNTQHTCDMHINAGLGIGWSSIVSELFEEANLQIYVHWEMKMKARKRKKRGESSQK